MSDDGGYRRDDPDTSRDAAKSIKVSRLMRLVLIELSHAQHPLNGWELSNRLDLPTITVVPRLAPLRRSLLIEQCGKRPGPSNREQIAYIITQGGSDFLSGKRPDIVLVENDDDDDMGIAAMSLQEVQRELKTGGADLERRQALWQRLDELYRTAHHRK